jgi:hypothetical protein
VNRTTRCPPVKGTGEERCGEQNARDNLSDADLRRAERRALQGTTEEQAEYLGALLRKGEIAADALALASYLEYEPAALLLGSVSPPSQWTEWVGGLVEFGVEATLRACIAATRYVLPLCRGPRPQILRALLALDGAEERLDRTEPPGSGQFKASPLPHPIDLAAFSALESTLHLVTLSSSEARLPSPHFVSWPPSEGRLPSVAVRIMGGTEAAKAIALSDAAKDAGLLFDTEGCGQAESFGDEARALVRTEGIRAELVSWLLGPGGERVERRTLNP